MSTTKKSKGRLMEKKYSPFKRYYIISDKVNKYYWVKSIPYGYNYQNQAVFEARFSDKFADTPALLEYDEALEVLERFKSPHIVGGRFKADTSALEIERRPEILTDEDMKLLGFKTDEQDS